MIHSLPMTELLPGGIVRLDVEPPIAVVRTADGAMYAIDDTCSHQVASLADGWVEDCTVTCPLHEASFDLRTGEPSCGPARRPIRTHDLVIEGDLVHVVVSEATPNLPPARRVRLAS